MPLNSVFFGLFQSHAKPPNLAFGLFPEPFGFLAFSGPPNPQICFFVFSKPPPLWWFWWFLRGALEGSDGLFWQGLGGSLIFLGGWLSALSAICARGAGGGGLGVFLEVSGWVLRCLQLWASALWWAFWPIWFFWNSGGLFWISGNCGGSGVGASEGLVCGSLGAGGLSAVCRLQAVYRLPRLPSAPLQSALCAWTFGGWALGGQVSGDLSALECFLRLSGGSLEGRWGGFCFSN